MTSGSIFSNYLFVHSFVCPITHSFLNGFQPNLYQHFPMCALPVILFPARKHLNIFVKVVFSFSILFV